MITIIKRLGFGYICVGTLVAIIVVFTMTSCGARKTNKSVTEENTVVKKDSVVTKKETTDVNIKKEITTVVDEKDSTITEIVEIKPIDATKPAYYSNGGKTENITNAYFKKTKVFKITSKKKKENAVLDEVMSKKLDNNIKTNTLAKADFKQLDKQTEREQYSYWWLLIPIALLVITYMAYRKYRNII